MNSVITAKKIQVLIKQGYTPEEVAGKYRCTDEELRERLRQLYSSGDGSKAKSVYDQLVANRKKPRKKMKKQEAPAVTTTTTKEDTLKTLKEEEKNLVDEVMQLETRHKELSSDHRACIKELRSLQEKIESIKSSLKSCKEAFDDIVKTADDIANQMNEISSVRKEKKTRLESVRQTIEDICMITICVTADGNIETPDEHDFTLNDEGFREIKNQIAEREECLDLRVRDVTTLARLLKICEGIDYITLICDHAELEKAFWTIRNRK